MSLTKELLRCSNLNEITDKLGIPRFRYGKRGSKYIAEFIDNFLGYALPDHDTYTLVECSTFGGEESMYVAIDDGILNTILHLNAAGYRTQWCCEGHLSEGKKNPSDQGYICFGFDANKASKEFKKAVSDLWTEGIIRIEIDRDHYTREPRFIIRWDIGNAEEKKTKLLRINEILGRL